MNSKWIPAALGACTLLAGTNSFAELNAVGRSYISQLTRGGSVSISSVAQDLYHIGYADTQVLDVAAEVLLDKYPQAGNDRDAVDAMSWLCRALGKSGNSRYRPTLEQVGNDTSAHRRLRSNCAKGAQELPVEVSDPFTAGTVELSQLRRASAASGAAAPTAPTGSMAKATAAAAAAGIPSGALWNPPPANRLHGYGGYELKPTTVRKKSPARSTSTR